MHYTPVRIKAATLSKGVQLDNQLLTHFGLPFLEKRRAYGNPDPAWTRKATIPQEFYLDPHGKRLVVSVNASEDSPWTLSWSDNAFCIKGPGDIQEEISFPKRPGFYDKQLDSKNKVTQVITLYGGGALGIFAYGKCQLVMIGKPCHYCSIAPNRDKETDFFTVINEATLYDSLRLALADPIVSPSQVMLNGGNFPDMDKSFRHYVNLAKTASRAIHDSGKKVELHLIVYPPKNLELISELAGLDVCISMNLEVFDSGLFAKYCPGKLETAGQAHIIGALNKAVEVLGKGRVFSIFVGGLEPIESLAAGLNMMAGNGITPVINVLHTDPETPLQDFPNPEETMVMEMGHALQQVYQKHQLSPFYLNCGRNSLDTEAYFSLF